MELDTLESRTYDLNLRFAEFVAERSGEVAGHFDPLGPGMAGIRQARLYSIGEHLPVPPALLPREALDAFGRAHRAFRRAMDLVFDRRMGASWDTLADELGLEAPTRRYLHGDRRPHWLTVSRPDVVLNGDRFTVVEPNAGSSCGVMPDADILGRLFESAPVIGAELERMGARRPSTMAAMAAYLRSRLRAAGEPEDGLIVVSEFGEQTVEHPSGIRFELSDPDFYHCDVFAGELRRHGLRADVCATEELDVGGSGVACRGERCSLVYRICAEEPDPVGHLPKLAPLLEAWRDGRVVLVDDLGDQIAGNKTVLAPLSEELHAGRLPAALTAALDGFVPWTRIVRDGPTSFRGETVDLLRWCVREQDALVLKPGAGFCGRGVLLGCETPEEEWRSALDEAEKSSECWIVQELARSSPHPVAAVHGSGLAREETYVDYGYFSAGGRVPTGAVRKNAPAGEFTRKVKRCGIGPVFFV